MDFIFNKTDLLGVLLINSLPYNDHRGFLAETYNKEIFKKNGIDDDFFQSKYSYSKKNVLRGMHFQSEPYGQSKLVSCSFGEIYDVVVDLRNDSPTFAKWQGFKLSQENKNLLYIPEGFAHGFLVMNEEGACFNYMISKSPFNKKNSTGISYKDPDIAISWPISDKDIILSDIDNNLPFLNSKNLKL